MPAPGTIYSVRPDEIYVLNCRISTHLCHFFQNNHPPPMLLSPFSLLHLNPIIRTNAATPPGIPPLNDPLPRPTRCSPPHNESPTSPAHSPAAHLSHNCPPRIPFPPAQRSRSVARLQIIHLPFGRLKCARRYQDIHQRRESQLLQRPFLRVLRPFRHHDNLLAFGLSIDNSSIAPGLRCNARASAVLYCVRTRAMMPFSSGSDKSRSRLVKRSFR